VNKSRLLERIAETVREKIIEGIADLRDESDRDGVRVVIELKREAMAEVVLNQLYRHTPLQTSFGVNMLALNGGRPELLNLKSILLAFIAFREEVITKRAVFELRKTRERAHLLVGLAIAVANIDPVIALIRAAKDPQIARDQLMARAWQARDVEALIKLIDEPGRAVAADGTYRLSEEQAKAILELRLQRLTGLERDKIAAELGELSKLITDYLDVLGSRARRLDILRNELKSMKTEFATPRRTTIEEIEFEQDIEDLIQREEMVVTVSHGGYIKRVPLSAFRAQRRGGKGRAAMATREEDFVSQIFVADTHTPMLLFSTSGMVYKTKVYRLPLGTPQARGRALVNLLPLEEGETISTVMPLPEDESAWDGMFVMFATAAGDIRRNRLSDFTNVMANGKIAMKLEGGDRLIGVQTCRESDDVLLAARGGRSIRFPVSEVRVFSGRTSTGVRGIKLGKDDQVVSMSILAHVEAETPEREAYIRWANARRRQAGEEAPAEPAEENETPAGEAVELSPERLQQLADAEEFILSVTVKGFGKRSSAYEYRITGRGGQGIVNIATSERNGAVVASFPVGHKDQIMLVTDGGQLIRCPVADIRIAGRNTQGVMIFKVAEGERVVSVIRIEEIGDGDGANGAAEQEGNGAVASAADQAALEDDAPGGANG
jgi:DNA gyrase subunit A